MREPKPYVSLAELASLIPFSEQAIRMLMRRGELREGEHYFRRGRRLVFKWSVVAEWIEGPKTSQPRAIVDLIRCGGLR